MSNKDQERIVSLQRRLKIAKFALAKIKFHGRDAHGVASGALEEIEQLEWNDRPTPLKGLVKG